MRPDSSESNVTPFVSFVNVRLCWFNHQKGPRERKPKRKTTERMQNNTLGHLSHVAKRKRYRGERIGKIEIVHFSSCLQSPQNKCGYIYEKRRENCRMSTPHETHATTHCQFTNKEWTTTTTAEWEVFCSCCFVSLVFLIAFVEY